MYRHSFYPLFFLTILMVAVGQMTQTLYVPIHISVPKNHRKAARLWQKTAEGIQ